MALLYIGLGLYITFSNAAQLPGVFQTVFSQAFDFQAIFGGFAGSCVMHGVKRGLFSNEAGMGSAPNASAAADVSHPAKQGMVQMLSVFIDTLLICTTTAMMSLGRWGGRRGLYCYSCMRQQAVSAEIGEARDPPYGVLGIAR